MPLTDSACRNARCPEDRLCQRCADAGGLYLAVTQTGAKLWRWKYRYAGKEKRLVGLADAGYPHRIKVTSAGRIKTMVWQELCEYRLTCLTLINAEDRYVSLLM